MHIMYAEQETGGTMGNNVIFKMCIPMDLAKRAGPSAENQTYNCRYGFLTFSLNEANPLSGWCVRMSKTWNLDSNVVAISLFI